jgi:hypothetical protein
MLCLWRWSIPAAIPRINWILCSSLNFTFESYNNLSKLPNQSNLRLKVRNFLHNQMKNCNKCLWFDLIWIDLIPPLQYSKTMTGWGPSNETPNIRTTFGCGGNSLHVCHVWYQKNKYTHLILSKWKYHSTRTSLILSLS